MTPSAGMPARRWLILTVLGLGQLIVILDVAVLNRQPHPDQSSTAPTASHPYV